MANYRTIRMSFWNDPFVEEMTAEAKLLYLYLFTSPHTNNLGILEITTRKMSFETGLAETSIVSTLAFLESAGKVVMDGKAIWLCNFIKNQTATSVKMIAGLRTLFKDVQSQKIRAKAIERYPAILGVNDDPSNGDNSSGTEPNTHSTRIDTPSNGMQAPPDGIDTSSEGTEAHSGGIDTPPIPILKKEKEREREIKRKEELPYPSQARGECDGQDRSSALQAEEMPGARHGSRENGDNPRATGNNPRALGTNPRATGDNQREKRKSTGNSLPELQAQMRDYTDNPALLKTLEDFRLMRERLRKPMTGRALEILLGKLSELAVDDTAKIAVLEQSILNSWQAIYPLKQAQDARASPGQPVANTEFQQNRQKSRLMAGALLAERRKDREARDDGETIETTCRNGACLPDGTGS